MRMLVKIVLLLTSPVWGPLLFLMNGVLFFLEQFTCFIQDTWSDISDWVDRVADRQRRR